MVASTTPAPLRKSVGAGDSTVYGQFNNGGLVDLRAGTLLLGSNGAIGGTSSGQFTAAAGTDLVFQGTHTFTPTSSIQGDQVSFLYSSGGHR